MTNVVLIDLYVAVSIVVGGARYDNAGSRQQSGVALLADTVEEIRYSLSP